MTRRVFAGLAGAGLTLLALAGCGGGGAASSGPTTSAGTAAAMNVQAISVNGGPTGQFPNSVMTSVTICVPGTSTCETIPDVQVDTGSSGLRLLASLVTIALPAVVSSSNGSVYHECAGFADGVVWGALATADVKLAGESASAIPVQIIQDSAANPGVPASCSAQGAPEDTQALLGANGILGVGLFLQDCGAYCAANADTIYYLCAGNGSCSPSAIPVAAQVSNPAAFFSQDNNGVILQLPQVAASGAPSADGSMIFGIGTQANNSLSGSVVGVPDSGGSAGAFTALYRGTTLPNSFFDSGSAGLYFDDAAIPVCPSTGPAGDLSGYYCPGPATALSAMAISVTITGSNGVSAAVPASVANAQYLYTQAGAASLSAFNDLAGPAGATLSGAFDFGVPFFFGKRVATAFEQRTTSVAAGPYFAYQTYP